MKKLISRLLRPFGMEANPKGTGWEKDALVGLYRDRLEPSKRNAPTATECIVFSKDRPLQLHALVSSFYEKVSVPVRMHVLYHGSTAQYKEAYEELAGLFTDKKVRFVEQRSEQSFKDDLLGILAQVDSGKIFFLVDDIIFVEDLDLDDFTGFDVDIYVPTLRLGRNITRCYHVDKDQPQPTFVSRQHGGNPKFFWKWAAGEYDWGYPLSLDGNLFSTEEICSMIKRIDFKAPNSLESKLTQFAPLFDGRYGICYEKAIIVNNPCNMVQCENENKSGGISQDYLLEQWRNGFQIDYKKLFGFVNISPQQEIEFQLIPRTLPVNADD